MYGEENTLKIAVCDDNTGDLHLVLELLAEYRVLQRDELYFEGFGSAVDLLASMERKEYDLLFLDIMMPGLSGFEAAQEIRQKNDAVRLVFLTSSPEFAVDSYTVQATNYLLKPITKERLYPVLDKLSAELIRPQPALTIRSQSGVLRLPFDRLESVEVLSKMLYFHMEDGTIREVHGTLTEYEPLILAQPGFHKVHRSYIVNFRWVTEIHQKELITIAGRHIPIARSAYQQVRTAYLEYLFASGSQENEM